MEKSIFKFVRSINLFGLMVSISCLSSCFGGSDGEDEEPVVVQPAKKEEPAPVVVDKAGELGKLFTGPNAIVLNDQNVVNALYDIVDIFNTATGADNISAAKYLVDNLNPLRMDHSDLKKDVVLAIARDSQARLFNAHKAPTANELKVFKIMGSDAAGLSQAGLANMVNSVASLNGNKEVAKIFLGNAPTGDTFPTDCDKFELVANVYLLDPSLDYDQAHILDQGTGAINPLLGNNAMDKEDILKVAVLLAKAHINIDEKKILGALALKNMNKSINKDNVQCAVDISEAKMDVTSINFDNTVKLKGLHTAKNMKGIGVLGVLNAIFAGCNSDQSFAAKALETVAQAPAIFTSAGLQFTTVLAAYKKTALGRAATDLLINSIVIDSSENFPNNQPLTKKMSLVTVAGVLGVAEFAKLNEASGLFNQNPSTFA